MYKIIGADQKQYGPVSADEMRQWIAEGRVNGQTLIQAEGQADWRPLSSFPEFATAAQPLPSGAPLIAGDAAAAQSLINGPAIGLLVVGGVCALLALAGIAMSLLGVGMGALGQPGGPAGTPPQMQKMVALMYGGGVIIRVIQLAISGFIIFGGLKMRKLESYGLVMAATIVSMVPCISPCCCIGLPVGIWILIVLCKPEVKSAFH